MESSKFSDLAAKIYTALGGDDNVDTVEYCATRLRVEVVNIEEVDQASIRATGVPGIKVVGKNSIQVIIGTDVQFIADEVEKMRKRKRV